MVAKTIDSVDWSVRVDRRLTGEPTGLVRRNAVVSQSEQRICGVSMRTIDGRSIFEPTTAIEAIENLLEASTGIESGGLTVGIIARCTRMTVRTTSDSELI